MRPRRRSPSRASLDAEGGRKSACHGFGRLSRWRRMALGRRPWPCQRLGGIAPAAAVGCSPARPWPFAPELPCVASPLLTDTGPEPLPGRRMDWPSGRGRRTPRTGHPDSAPQWRRKNGSARLGRSWTAGRHKQAARIHRVRGPPTCCTRAGDQGRPAVRACHCVARACGGGGPGMFSGKGKRRGPTAKRLQLSRTKREPAHPDRRGGHLPALDVGGTQAHRHAESLFMAGGMRG